MTKEQPYFGGQAVVEGVLMKGKYHVAIAVRKPNKKIKVRVEKINSIAERYTFLAWPFFRGIVSLFEMLILGLKALTYSANEAANEEDEKLTSLEIAFTLSFSVVFSLLLFVVLPYAMTHYLGFREDTQSFLFNAIDGALKLFLFVSYVFIISLMPDIKRIFQYHGAEHKAINCFEASNPLRAKSVQSFPTLHPRCGTSFILLVIMVGIFIFSFAPTLVVLLYPSFTELSWWTQRGLLLLLRIFLLLPVAGVSYEVLKLAGRHRGNVLLQAIVFPGLLVQKLTTQEPDDKQAEVSIAALTALLKAEGVAWKK